MLLLKSLHVTFYCVLLIAPSLVDYSCCEGAELGFWELPGALLCSSLGSRCSSDLGSCVFLPARVVPACAPHRAALGVLTHLHQPRRVRRGDLERLVFVGNWADTWHDSQEPFPCPSQAIPSILSLQNVDQHLFTLPQGYGQFAFGIFDDSFEFPFGSNTPSEDNRDSENRREREHQSRHRYGARQPRARLATRRAAGRHEGVPTLEG